MKNYLALALIGLTVAGAASLSNAAANAAPQECLPVLRFPPENPAVTPPGHPVLYSQWYYLFYEPFCAGKPADKCIWACIKVPTCRTRCAS